MRQELGGKKKYKNKISKLIRIQKIKDSTEKW